MAREWTPAQLAAIEETEKTLLVSAAAGSGKTAVLTERIIRTLTDPENPADIGRMLIVTFTRAAAAELRARISAAISAAMGTHRSAHLARQLLLLPSARISTIDSFCLDLVRENAVSLGLSPSFRLADPTENRLLISGIMEQLIEECYEGVDPSLCSGEAFCALADCLSAGRSDSGLSEILLDLYDDTRGFARSYHALSDLAEALLHAAPDPLATPWGAFICDKLREEADYYLGKCRQMADALAGESAEGRAALSGDCDVLARILAATAGDYDSLRGLVVGTQAPAFPKLTAKVRTPLLTQAKALHKEVWDDLIAGWGQQFFAYTGAEWADLLPALGAKVSLLGRLLSAFGDRVAEEKRRRGICDFGDLAHHALRLLTDADGLPTPLAHELSRELDWVYIDEYQDVNEVQHRIFEAISRPDNRFMVGDIKQSIYGFRGAQPEIFAGIRRTYPTADRAGRSHTACMQLSTNFRSRAGVLRFVNLVFGRLMEGVGDRIGYVGDDALVPGRPDESDGRDVRVLLVERSASDTPADPPRAEADPDEDAAPAAEEYAVADEIARLLSAPRGEGLPPPRPGDIAILCPTGKGVVRFAEALAARGIPYEAGVRHGFFLNPEIQLALSLLNVIDNPRRDIWLAGLLRSPLYGFTMDDLVLIRHEAQGRAELRDCTLYEALCAYVEAHPDFARGTHFLARLSAFRRMAEGRPVDALIWQLYRETGLLALAGGEGEGDPEARRANLMLLYDYARRFEASSFKGLYSFIAYINEAIEKGRSIDDSASSDVAAPDAVRVMTIHHSKGLEFPICFVVDCGRGFNRKDGSSPLLFDRDLGCAMRLRDESGLARLRNPVYNVIGRAILDRQLEEYIRVLYVALTRARDTLYVTATVKDPFALPARSTDGEIGAAAVYACRSFIDMVFLARRSTQAPEYMLKIIGPTADAARAATGTGDNACTPLAANATDAACATLAANAADATDADTSSNSQEAAAAAPGVEELYALFSSRFDFVYPHRYLCDLPGKMSVSRLYPTALDGTEGEAMELFSSADPSAEQGTRAAENPEKPDPCVAKTGKDGLLLPEDPPCHPEADPPSTKLADGGAPGLAAAMYAAPDAPADPAVPADGTAPARPRVIPRFLGGERSTAAEAGTATHLFLQFCDLENLQSAGAAAELQRLLDGGFIDPTRAALVRLPEIEKFAASQLFAQMRAGGRLWRELRFNVHLPAAAFTAEEARRAAYAGQDVLVQGVIDGLLEGPDGGLLLFDYKTDRLSPAGRRSRAVAEEELRARHRVQLIYYAAAVRRIFGRLPTRVVIYSLALGDTVEVPLDPAEIP